MPHGCVKHRTPNLEHLENLISVTRHKIHPIPALHPKQRKVMEVKNLNKTYIVTGILIAFAITFSLRALPFALFSGNRKMPEKLDHLGKTLPATIMAVLIVYCIKDAVMSLTDIAHFGWEKFAAVLVVGLVYKSRLSKKYLSQNMRTFLAIVIGTAAYMIFINVMS